ncbi:MAG: hypothetical protein KDB27_12410 [Planctomycetales bacterium]|nr:hypothetical protein [Planctomycetales bacterium]
MKAIVDEVEELLTAAGPLPNDVSIAVDKLLNAVEVLAAQQQSLSEEVKRLRKKLEKKKNGKTTNDPSDPASNGGDDEKGADKKRRRSFLRRCSRQTEFEAAQAPQDRRSFKDLPIHDTMECPIDPATLPPDAVRVEDEIVIVQGVEVKPKNTKLQRHVYFSPQQKKHFRAPLPAGFDQGDFSADLRALIISLKYSGSKSEPKIGEFLENFDVQVSAGSTSNVGLDRWLEAEPRSVASQLVDSRLREWLVELKPRCMLPSPKISRQLRTCDKFAHRAWPTA